MAPILFDAAKSPRVQQNLMELQNSQIIPAIWDKILTVEDINLRRWDHNYTRVMTDAALSLMHINYQLRASVEN